MTLVSIIVPCFDSGLTIGPTLYSIKRQSCNDFECIIVDDCSTDDSLAVIDKFVGNDKRFKVIRLSSNSGVVFARNTGLRNSTGRYVAFLDSDDLWVPSFLSDSILAHQSHFGGLVHSPYWRFKKENEVFSVHRVDPPLEVNLDNIYHKNYLPLLTTVSDRHVVGDLQFPSTRPEDYALWACLFRKGSYSSVSLLSASAFYRVSDFQRSSNKLKAVNRLYHFYANFLGFSNFTSLPMALRWSLLNLFQRRHNFVPANGYVLDELMLLHSPPC